MSPVPTQRNHEPTIQLRSDLKAYVRSDGRAVIEDPVVGKHFRLGAAEYRFVVHLAHTRSAAKTHCAVAQFDQAWTQESSQQLLSWLANRGLLSERNKPSETPPVEGSKSRQPVDPLFYRVSFGCPEGWTSAIARSVRPVLKSGWSWFAALLVVTAAVGLITNWPQFSTAYKHLLSQRGALTLAACGLVLKVLHELGHCIACHHWGGRVREWGVLLICGAPLPFVDVSDSRRFSSLRARVAVALAGVVAEMLAAAIFVVCALILDTPTACYVAAHLVLTLGLSAVLFNLNPLMKFDGYYVLADCCGVDNLYSRGAEFTQRLGARLFLGRSVCTTFPTPLLVQVYGLASFGWRTLAIVAIGCVAIQTLHGIGLLLVAFSVWRIWGRSLFQFLRSSLRPSQEPSETQPRFASLARPTAFLALILGCICYLPVPFETTTYATVEYDPPSIIRSPTDAFVEAVLVTENEEVEPGQLLLTLRSETLSERLKTLELACLRHEQRIRAARSQQAMQELKAAQSDLLSATELRRQAAAEVASLQVRSPVGGVVTGRNLDQLSGTYLTAGSEISAIGREDTKRLRALPTSESSELFFAGKRIRFLTPTGDSGEATIAKVLPRATRQADSSALGTHHGGPLEVAVDESGTAEFSSSHTPVLVALNRQQSQAARVGQRVAVSVGERKTIVEWLWGIVWD